MRLGFSLLSLAIAAHAGVASAQADLNYFRSHAPSDTALYVDSAVDPVFKNFYGNSGDIAELEAAINGLGEGPDAAIEPEGIFAMQLWLKLLTALSQTPADQARLFGLSDDASYALYLDGMAPVLQFPVADMEQFKKYLMVLEKEAGVGHSDLSLDDHNVMTWRFTHKEPGLSAAMSFAEGYITMSLLLDEESKERQRQRMALQRHKVSLQDSGKVAKLVGKYDFDESGIVFLDTVNFVKIFAEGKGVAQQDLQRLDKKGADGISPVCVGEYLSLASGVPLLAMGSHSLTVQKDGVLSTDGSAILEIANPSVLQELIKLNGHLSPSATRNGDQIIGLSVGLDVAQLTPVLGSLWGQFVQAEFKCQELVDAQQRVKQMNPAAIAPFTGMLYSVKGASAELFDVELSENGQMESIDALVSVSSESPETLLAILANLPQLQGFPLPQRGRDVALPLPVEGMPNPLVVTLGIRGNNIVAYTGAKSQQSADDVAREALNRGGIYGASADFQKMGEVATSLMGFVSGQEGMTAQTCADARIGMQEFQRLDAEFEFSQKFNSQGAVTRVKIKARQPEMQGVTLSAGDYRVDVYDLGCEWVPFGQEHISTDGTGSYAAQDESGQCNVYQVEYEWRKEGTLISFDEQSAASRVGCESEFVPEDTSGYQCRITSASQDGFECLYNYGTDERLLYRYTRQ